jgi:DNA-directed RNA polymerase specialized sigma24 family protein
MSLEGSVTRWIGLLQSGDPAAAQRLWERYFQSLVRLARRRLGQAARAAADEEDVALSAFDSFCRRAARGRFPQLQDRHDLWRLLVAFTARKAGHLLRQEGRLKRRGASHSEPRQGADGTPDLEQVVGREPTPEFAAQLVEDYQRLLDRLGDTQLQTLAQWKLEGYTNEEIAGKLTCTPRTIERKLRLIRTIWEKEGAA